MTSREWLVSGLWLVGVIAGLAWVLPKLRLEDEWDEAIEMDEEWVDAGHPVGPTPVKPQILDQSNAWQDRARRAEGADDTWDGAA